MAKSYKEFKKKHPSVKTPWLGWVLNSVYTYVVFLLIAAIVVSIVFYENRGVYAKLERVGDKPSEFLTISTDKAPSVLWAENIINTSPLNIESWDVKPSVKPVHIVKIKGCNNVGYDLVTVNVLSSYVASGGGIKTGIQLISPGLALDDFNKYVNEINSCMPVDVVNDDSLKLALYNDNSFLMLAGDVLLNVETDNSSKRQELINFYSNLVSSTLIESGCNSLVVDPADKARAFYTDLENYKGLLEKTVVNTDVNVSGLPTPVGLKLNDIDSQRAKLVEPEKPLPKDFPTMPKSLEKPVIPVLNESSDNFSKDAVYTVKDISGPGCGWVWHGQIPPVFNDEVLDENKKIAIQNTQNEIDTNAENYIKNNIAWNLKLLKVYPLVNSWNVYISKVNAVYDKWEWLNGKREELFPLWQEYVKKYDYWKNFDAKKKESQDAYDKAVKICDDAKQVLEKWNNDKIEAEKIYNEQLDQYSKDYSQWVVDKNKWDKDKENNGGVNNAPEPVEPVKPELNLAPEPPGCPKEPEKPSILSEERPEEPAEPEIPEGVTIPDSWVKVDRVNAPQSDN